MLGGGGSRSSGELHDDLLLDAIKTKHTYVLPNDLNQVNLRVAWVDTSWSGSKVSISFVVGMLRSEEGLFRGETEAVSLKSIQALLDELDSYVDRMPVGLLVTVDGRVANNPGFSPPAAFNAFIKELQEALTGDGFRYAFILPNEFHVVR